MFPSPSAPTHPGITGPALDVAGLSFSRPVCGPVLQDISLRVEQGELLAVIGPNGGGKTTLLRLILGLLEPQRGHIRVFGKSPAEAGRRMGYVPQFATMQPDFPASVLEMTLMGAARSNGRGGGWPTGAKARKQALAYLELLGLEACAQKPVGSLSGGQSRRALVARALMSSPEPLDPGSQPQTDSVPFLLLLDEPTAGIDPEGAFCFYEFLGKLRSRVSILVVSHDLFMVSPFFNRVAFVNTTLTLLSNSKITPDVLTTMFGRHMHECPVADMQHAHGAAHASGCTHPACNSATGPFPDGKRTAAPFGARAAHGAGPEQS